jgi:protocatechuate 3,4-dioxygenase beta subunit
MRWCSALAFVALIAPALAAQQRSPSSTPTLRGVVTTANNEPLPRVRVAVSDAPSTEPAVLTDDRGQFTVRLREVDSSRLTFTKSRYATLAVDVRRSELKEQDVGLVVRMALGGAISGYVRDQFGAPVLRAPVIARQVSTPASPDPPVLTTNTDDLGEFRFGGLAAGAYVLYARAPAALPTPEQTVNVGFGAEISGIDMRVEVRSAFASRNIVRPSSNLDATASLRGRVLSPAGGPIAGAIVQAYRNGVATDAVESDARGRYAIDRLPAGDYTVLAVKDGFITPRAGQGQSVVEVLLRNDSASSDRIVSLRGGQTVDGIDVTLTRGGAITGTIVDEFGEPMQGVAVNALELRVMGGRTRALRGAAGLGGNGVRTDDRGRYRLFGLQSGAYVVQAVASDVLPGANGYLPLFYPGTQTVDVATPTTIDLDGTVGGLDFVLTPGPARRIRGTLLDPAGDPANVMLTLTVSERSRGILTEPVTARTNTDGSFVFNNVAPGEYVVQGTGIGTVSGSSTVAVARQFASAHVTVADADPSPLVMRLSRGATLTGRVVYEGIPAPTTSSVSLTAVPADFDRSPILGTGDTGFSLLSDQTFEYRGVFGPSFLIAQPKNPAWYVKSITYQGQDLTDSAFDFGSTEAFSDIEVVISGAGASLTGHVTDERATPVRTYRVVLFPTDRAKWTLHSRWLKTGAATHEGAFQLTGVVPGDYWVAAIDRLEGSEVAGDLQNAEFLDALSSRAVRVTLAEGQSQLLTLRLARR